MTHRDEASQVVIKVVIHNFFKYYVKLVLSA